MSTHRESATVVQHLTPQEVRFTTPHAARTAKLAELLGWSLTWASHQHRAIKARSPIDNKEVLIPVSTSVNARRSKAALQQILTHSPKDKVDGLFDAIQEDLTKDPDLAELALELGMIGRRVEEQMQERREEIAGQLATEVVEHIVGTLVSEVQVTHTTDGKPMKGQWWAVATRDGTYYECRDHDPPVRVETVAGVGGHNRMMHGDPEEVAATLAKAHASSQKVRAEKKARATEVSRVPWLAKRGGVHPETGTGRVYEHSYVDEVTYADGTVEYECNICHEYTNAKGRPVANHVGNGHKDREHRGQPSESRVITDYPQPAWHRRAHSPKLRTEVLAALDSIEDWHLLSQEELAIRIEEHIMAARPERQPAEPLTDSEILVRISMLLDRGQFDHLRHEVADLTEMVTTLTTQRDDALIAAETATREADRRRANLRALQELIDEAAQAEAAQESQTQ